MPVQKELKNAYIGEWVDVTSLTLDKSSINLTTVGQTEQITATTVPAGATVNWSSDDTTVATVSSSGLVTCVTPGECTITATTVNGLTASCSVMQSRLPAEYQEVEYVESSSSQYIDTGWYPDGTCEIEFTFMPLSGTGTGIFGVDSGWTRRAFSVFTDRIFCYGSQYQPGATYFQSDIKYKVTFHNLTCKVDDVTRFTYNSETFTSSYSAYLFAKRRNSYIETYAKEKVYSLKLWRGGTLERDFVPCYRKADNVIGMYDLVNDVFYTNSGSGTFNKGSDV